MTTFAEKAEPLLLRGWPVFPVTPMGDKAPLTKHGFKDASLDRAQIAEWSRRFPDANVSVPTGPVTDLAVLDIDGPEGEQSLTMLAKTRGIRFWPTLEAASGRGRHCIARDLALAIGCAFGSEQSRPSSAIELNPYPGIVEAHRRGFDVTTTDEADALALWFCAMDQLATGELQIEETA